MNQALEPFIHTVGTDGTLTLPLLDAKTNGIVQLVSGPLYARNALRFYVRMPSLKESCQYPRPMQYDPDTIRFEPKMLLFNTWLPSDITGHLYRISGPEGGQKLAKTKFHHWTPNEETIIYPAIRIQYPFLKPEQILEFEGVSYWKNPLNNRKSKSTQGVCPVNQYVKNHVPVQFLMIVKFSWLPRKSVTSPRVHYVKGSPLLMPSPAPTQTDAEFPSEPFDSIFPPEDTDSNDSSNQ